MAVNLSPLAGVGAQFLDNNGNVLTGGKLYSYAAGTTTPQTTYTNAAGTVANSNPIILNASGRVPTGEIWLTDGLVYKFALYDANDVLIATYDNITGINSNFVNFTNKQEIQTATAGQTVFTLTTMQYQPGTNSLTVFVDGVNQYGPGASYSYVETDSSTVTFNTGLHVGAEVKFTTSQLNSTAGNDAFLVSYVPPFTGSVGTNVGAKLSETVSVKDFGAVGDGVADDTAAIQAAVNAAGGVYFPEGTYLVSAQINVSSNNSLYGNGDAVIAPYGAYNGTCFRGDNVSNVRFDGLRFDGFNSTISIGTSSDIYITKCWFLNSTGTGLGVISGSSRVWISENYVDNSVGMGMALHGVTEVMIANNTIKDTGDNGIAVRALTAGSSKNIVIEGNTIYNAGKCGIKVTTETTTTPGMIIDTASIIGNTIYGWGAVVYEACISVAGRTNTDRSKNITVSGNSLVGVGNPGEGVYINFSQCNYVSITGNTAVGGCQRSGIIGSGTNYASVSGNVVEKAGLDVGGTATNDRAGIALVNTFYSSFSNNTVVDVGSVTEPYPGIIITRSRYNSITGNTCVAPTAATMSYGIDENPAGALSEESNFNCIVGNVVSNATVASIRLSNVGAAGKTIAMTNLGDWDTKNGSYTFNSGATTRSFAHDLSSTPTRVTVTPKTSLGSATKYFVSVDATNVTITTDLDPGVNVQFWYDVGYGFE